MIIVGLTGRPVKPTPLKILHGDRKDRVNTQEPKPSAIEVVPPSWLSRPARTVWNQYAPDLIRAGVLTAWDVEEFGGWCDAAARRRRAVRRLEREGEVIKLPVFNKNGELTGHRVAKNPWMLVLVDADNQLVRFGARFGMTPSDRASLTIGSGVRDDDDDLLTGSG